MAKAKAARIANDNAALLHVKMLAAYDKQPIEVVVANIVTSLNCYGPRSTAQYFAFAMTHPFDWLPRADCFYRLGYLDLRTMTWKEPQNHKQRAWEKVRWLRLMPPKDWFTTKLPARIVFNGPRVGKDWGRIYESLPDALAAIEGQQANARLREEEYQTRWRGIPDRPEEPWW